jgi:rod shape-determining protein MreC
LDTLLINCGTERGISEGQAVLSQGYVVGKITYASRGSSTVLLITNSKFTIDARLSKTGASGIVGGSFGTGLILDRLSQSDDAEAGWLVVTAGIDAKVPKNLLIGQVGEVISNRNDLFKKATVSSPIDFDSIDFVFVAKP